MVFELKPFRRGVPSTAWWREAIVPTTLAGLIIVNGFLAWENIALKSELALAARERAAGTIGPGDRLDPVEVLTPSGGRRALFSGPEEGPILLLIFNTSCPYCENTLPQWNRLAGLCADRGVEVLGVSLDDSGRTADYVARHEVRFAVASVVDKQYFSAHGIDGVPATILTDGGGAVIGTWPGEITPEAFLEMARWAAPQDRE